MCKLLEIDCIEILDDNRSAMNAIWSMGVGGEMKLDVFFCAGCEIVENSV